MPKAKQRDRPSGATASGRKSPQASRSLVKSPSDHPVESPSWLTKLGSFLKSLSSLDAPSASQAVTASNDVEVYSGPVDGDAPGEARSSQARSSTNRSSNCSSMHDSAFAHNQRRADVEAAAKRLKAPHAQGAFSLPPPQQPAQRARLPVLSMFRKGTLRFKKYLSSIRPESSPITLSHTTTTRPAQNTPQQLQTPTLLPAPRQALRTAPPAAPIETHQLPSLHEEPPQHPTTPLSPVLRQPATEPDTSPPPNAEQDWAQRTPMSITGHTSLQNQQQPQTLFEPYTPTRSTTLAMADDLPAGMDRSVWCIEDYADLQQLHAGYASYVYSATCRHSGKAVALKIYQPDLLHQISQHQLMREARLHVRLTHPNIIRLYAAFQQEDGVVLVQEYADGGDLLNFLSTSNSSRMSERRSVRLIIEPLLHALHYIHTKFIIHRDVKLENILFSGPNMTLKLADFGLCLSLREERSVTRAGTLDYMAPEVLKCPTKDLPEDNKDRLDLAYTCAVDVWSVGVLAFELLNGVPPFTRRERQETEQLIMDGDHPQFLVPVSTIAQEFIFSCLERMPQRRPSAWQLLRFPWAKIGSAPQPYASLNDGVSKSLDGLLPGAAAAGRGSLVASLKAGRGAPSAAALMAAPEPPGRGEAEQADHDDASDRNTQPPHVLEDSDVLLASRFEPNR